MLGDQPEKYLEIELRPLAPRLAPGEEILVEAILRVIGEREIPVGEWGLLSPAMALRVRLEGRDEVYSDLPLLVWSVPRTLAPGQAYRQTLRLDVGPLGKDLAVRPTDVFALQVEGVVDPFQLNDPNRTVGSRLASLTPQPVRIERDSLLVGPERDNPALAGQALWKGLSYLRLDVNRGDVPSRVQAGRADTAADHLLAGRAAADGPADTLLMRRILADLPADDARAPAVREVLASVRSALSEPGPGNSASSTEGS